MSVIANDMGSSHSMIQNASNGLIIQHITLKTSKIVAEFARIKLEETVLKSVNVLLL